MKKLILITFLTLLSLQLRAQDDTLDFYVPNVFMGWDCDMSTEDGFHVYAISDITAYQLTMFNKWGEIVWESNDINDYWKPNEEAEGVYVWVITYSYLNALDYNGNYEESQNKLYGHTFYLN